jgi:nucleoside-diphosphate-sugar epimerase
VALLTRRGSKLGSVPWEDQIEIRSGDLTHPESLLKALSGVDVVFHLASYAPRPHEPFPYEADGHWSVTAEGSRHLIDAAIGAGVQRLVYFSSVKAMGESTRSLDCPADETTPSRPECAYGRAKLSAERCVLGAGPEVGMHVSVLRLPMVYGGGVDGNLIRMIRAIAGGRFPPWPPVNNRRSAVHVADVINAAVLVATDRRAWGETYLVTDGLAYSTRWLYERTCAELGRSMPKWYTPMWCLQFAAGIGSVGERMTGRSMPLTRAMLAKLVDDAWYSSSKIRDGLSFSTNHRLETEIPQMVERFR